MVFNTFALSQNSNQPIKSHQSTDEGGTMNNEHWNGKTKQFSILFCSRRIISLIWQDPPKWIMYSILICFGGIFSHFTIFRTFSWKKKNEKHSKHSVSKIIHAFLILIRWRNKFSKCLLHQVAKNPRKSELMSRKTVTESIRRREKVLNTEQSEKQQRFTFDTLTRTHTSHWHVSWFKILIYKRFKTALRTCFRYFIRNKKWNVCRRADILGKCLSERSISISSHRKDLVYRFLAIISETLLFRRKSRVKRSHASMHFYTKKEFD